MFQDRKDAGHQLAAALRDRPMTNPLVLALTPGGVVVGAVLSRLLGAELDVILVRRFHAPDSSAALWAVCESHGPVQLEPAGTGLAADREERANAFHRYAQAEMDRIRKLYRRVRPQAQVVGRSCIVVDDGVDTGARMTAACTAVRLHNPLELIAAVPAARPRSLERVRVLCDDTVCLEAQDSCSAFNHHYLDYPPVTDAQAVEILEEVSHSESVSSSAAI